MLSKILDWEDRSTLVLFGDGAGAVVLEPVDEGGFLGFELGADGGGGENLWLPGSGSRHFDDADKFVKMNGREVFKFATRVLVSSAQKVLDECGLTVDDVDVYVPHQANKRIIDHAAGKLGIPEEKVVVNVDRYGNTSSGRSARARRCGRRRAAPRGRARADDRNGSGPHLGLGVDRVESGRSCRVTKIAFMLPGPGLVRGRDGPRHRRGRARGDGGLRARQRRLRARPQADLLRRAGREPASTRRCSSRRSSRRASRSTRRLRARDPPDFVVGHSVGEFAALGAAESIRAAEAIGLVRERGLAMAEAARERPGSMAAILGLADEVVEALCRKIPNVWPANYNCPGQIVVSGEDDAVGECCAEAERGGRRRAVQLQVSGAFHSPLVARAADGCGRRSSGSASPSPRRRSCRP